jgi:hypothetical protein
MRRPLSEVTRSVWALLAVVAALGLRSFRTPFPNDTVPYLAVWLPLSSLPGTDAAWEEK